MSTTKLSAKLVAGAFAVGGALFVGIRWSSLVAESGLEWPSVAWFALPLLLTYAGAAAIGLILLKDGITRWWWVPAAFLTLGGPPVESWVSSASGIATGFGSLAGSLVDLVLVLAPGAVLVTRSHPTPTAIHDRVVPTVALGSVALVSAMLVGAGGPDASESVGAAMLAFGFCSQSTSWRRAAAFVAIALALVADVTGSFANSVSQGILGGLAIVDSSMDVAVALIAFSIAPVTVFWSRLLRRRTSSSTTPPATVRS